MNIDMAMAYLDFVPERHRVWEKRQHGQQAQGSWTTDPILAERKFTNVYRVLDHGSQFLVRELLGGTDALGMSPEDVLARCYLYRMTNRPQTWEYMRQQLGHYPYAADLGEPLADLLCEYRDSGAQVFSGAYIIMPQPGKVGTDKTREVVRLAARYFNPASADSRAAAVLGADTMQGRFKALWDTPGIGPFIAMQVLTDLGYSSVGADLGQDENDYVHPGPGCRNGAKEIWPGKKAEWVIEWCRERVLELPDCPRLPVGDRLLRPPSKMDIQNTLCEFSKYARFMRKADTGRAFRPAHPGTQLPPALPAHWS